MKIIYQSIHERSCGQHVVAMILNTTVDDIFYLFGHRNGTRGSEISNALNARGITVEKKFTRCKNFSLPEKCVVAIDGYGLDFDGVYKKYKHWAIYMDGFIYCSCRGKYHISNLIDGDIISYLELPNYVK